MVRKRLPIAVVAPLLCLLFAPMWPVGAAFGAPPTPVPHAGIGIRLLEEPSARRVDPRASRYVIDHIRAGGVFDRRFEVRNDSMAAVALSVGVAPATISDGDFVTAADGAPGRIPDWVTVTPSAVTLVPGKVAVAVMHVRVPADTASGEYYGLVYAEASSAGQIVVRNRVGIRVYLSVGPGKEPSSDFSIDSLQAQRGADGVPRAVAQVHNTGGRALDMRGSLRLTNGPGGLSGGPFNATLGTTLGVGQTEPVTVVLGKAIQGGPWHAVIDLKSGLLERKAEGDITFPDKAATESPAVKAKALPLYKDKNVVIPVAGVLIGLLVLTLLLLALREWLRRRKRSQP